MDDTHVTALPLPSIRALAAGASLLALALTAAPAGAATPEQLQRLIEQGDNQQALTASERYLSSHPDNRQARFTRALALAGLGRSDAAIEAFGELARENPKKPEYANNLAVLYANNGDYDKARRWLEAAMATDPAYATAHRNLGEVYTALAAVAYSKALEDSEQPADLGVQLDMVKTLSQPPEPTRVARNVRLPDPFTVPPVTGSPGDLDTGIGSPVIMLSSTLLVPSVTSPSTGRRSPGRTRMMSPGCRVSISTSRASPSTSTCAVLA